LFEFSQLRCFVAVAEELHFSRAAERLNMTQPPLSRQIRLLEHSVGVALLERTSRSVTLTAAGAAFLPEATRILRLAQEAAVKARRTASGEQGSLTIGFSAASGYSLLPAVVRGNTSQTARLYGCTVAACPPSPRRLSSPIRSRTSTTSSATRSSTAATATPARCW